jgi:hypothetical protein
MLEKRLAELKSEFNACEAKLGIIEADTLAKIEGKAAEAATSAYERALKFVEVTRNWLAVFLAFGAVLAVGSLLQVKSFAQDYVVNQVRAWLRVSDEDSPLHEPLSRLTTKVATDVLVIEKMRNGLRPIQIGGIRISAVWIDKMLLDLSSNATSLTDFADLALALSTEAPLTGGEHRGRILEALKKALLGDALDNHRKAILLRTFTTEFALRETAVQLFQAAKDIEVQTAAFQLIKETLSSSDVAKFGRAVLSSKLRPDNAADQYLILEAAEAIAKYDVKDPALATWLASRRDDKDLQVDNLLIGLAALEPLKSQQVLPSEKLSDAEIEARFSFAVSLLKNALLNGAEIGWTSDFARRPTIAARSVSTKTGFRSSYIPEPKSLLIPSLGNRLISAFGRDQQGLSRLVYALTAGNSDDGASIGRPFRIQVRLGKADSMRTTNGDMITMARIGNPVYLERSSEGTSEILMRWRDVDGMYRTAYLRDAEIKQAQVEIVAASPAMERQIDNYAYNNHPAAYY